MSEKLAIFRPQGLGTLLREAAQGYLADYVYSDDPDGGYADHELSQFETDMIDDFLNNLFVHDAFAKILQEAARCMKAGGADPEGPDSVVTS